jgi:hypothetical protein
MQNEFNTIDIKSGILEGFKTQDIINKGDLVDWKNIAILCG